MYSFKSDFPHFIPSSDIYFDSYRYGFYTYAFCAMNVYKHDLYSLLFNIRPHLLSPQMLNIDYKHRTGYKKKKNVVNLIFQKKSQACSYFHPY